MSTSAGLVVEGLVKSYGPATGERAVDGVSFTIEEGQFYTLLGPSGCGKSTTLRCIAGLERTNAGRISLSGRVMSDHRPAVFVRPEDRELSMVFQSYAIWPHMTVFDNVAFPLRAARGDRRTPRGKVRPRVMEALETVQMSRFADRMASQLSGGQQQRLALARALARQPRLLLLDEPLSNLDAKLRETMRTELRRLQRQAGLTTLYVTHDQSEALSMSNRVAVMENGKIVQEARPRELYRRPKTTFIASFVGRTNLIDARIRGQSGDAGLDLETSAGIVRAICPDGVQVDDAATLSIRPEDINLHATPPPDTPNVARGRVEYVLFLGECMEYQVSWGSELIYCRQHPDISFRRGQEVYVEMPIAHCVVVTEEYGTTNHGNIDEPDDDEGIRLGDPVSSAMVVGLDG